jgi:hypothetical protein
VNPHPVDLVDPVRRTFTPLATRLPGESLREFQASGLRGQEQRCTRPNQDPPRLPGESFRLTWPRATLHAPQPRSSPLAGREFQARWPRATLHAPQPRSSPLAGREFQASGLRGQGQRCTRPKQDPPRLPGESFRLGGQEQRCTRPNQDPPRLPGESFRLGGQEQRCTRPNQDPARLPGESFRFTWPRVTLHAPQPRSSPLAGREFQVYVAKSNAARAPTKILPARRARVLGLRGQEQRCTRPNQDPARLPGESFRLGGQEQRCTRPNQDPARLPGESFRFTWPRVTLHAPQPRSCPLAEREF